MLRLLFYTVAFEVHQAGSRTGLLLVYLHLERISEQYMQFWNSTVENNKNNKTFFFGSNKTEI